MVCSVHKKNHHLENGLQVINVNYIIYTLLSLTYFENLTVHEVQQDNKTNINTTSRSYTSNTLSSIWISECGGSVSELNNLAFLCFHMIQLAHMNTPSLFLNAWHSSDQITSHISNEVHVCLSWLSYPEDIKLSSGPYLLWLKSV